MACLEFVTGVNQGQLPELVGERMPPQFRDKEQIRVFPIPPSICQYDSFSENARACPD
jgi:hypothetical protein